MQLSKLLLQAGDGMQSIKLLINYILLYKVLFYSINLYDCNEYLLCSRSQVITLDQILDSRALTYAIEGHQGLNQVILFNGYCQFSKTHENIFFTCRWCPILSYSTVFKNIRDGFHIIIKVSNKYIKFLNDATSLKYRKPSSLPGTVS